MKSERIQQKIFGETGPELSRMLAFWRFRNYRIVFTNGCFDVLHRGHAEYLSKAADLGDVLIVGMNTDASVKRLKGASRPVNNEQNRAFLLASFGFVSAVVLFEEDTPEKLIESVKPDFLVKGADYNEKTIVGADFVKSYGGQIVTIDLVEGLSSSGIIDKLSS
jgi:rfaE bifunctional protein nucleotidyltransferase chain/domain